MARLVENKTQYIFWPNRIPNRLSQSTRVSNKYLPPHRIRAHTITYDSGLEYTENQKAARFLYANIYFNTTMFLGSVSLLKISMDLFDNEEIPHLLKSKLLNNVIQK